MTATDLAAACQEVENHVVGAPCGLMDQITSACGRRDRLLRLRCQPGAIEGYLEIPTGYRFYGIDSGISHAVSGADYGAVRTAAFMGYRMIAAAAGLPAEREGARLRIADPRWGGYLANLTGPEWAALAGGLPEEMSGAEFLKRYGGITDTATAVHSERRYPVRPATERSEEHTSELQSRLHLVCRLLLEKKKQARQQKHPPLSMSVGHKSNANPFRPPEHASAGKWKQWSDVLSRRLKVSCRARCAQTCEC